MSLRTVSTGALGGILLIGLALINGCLLFPNDPPVAVLTASVMQGVAPLEVEFDGSGSFDPDGHITAYSWSFGEGAAAEGAVVRHRFESPGRHEVRLTIRDNRRAASHAMVIIDVVASNDPPHAHITAIPQQGDAPLLVAFDGTGSSDPDGSIVSWEWEFGDGASGSGPGISHRYLSPGTYTARLTVIDNLSSASTASVQISVTEPPPFTRTITWEHGGRRYSRSVSIPVSLYLAYVQESRVIGPVQDYDVYVLDPRDDGMMTDIATWVRSQVGGDYHLTAECLFHFVQAAVAYSYDRPGFEYPKYPLETLVDEVGDCEDTAILYAALIRTLGAGARIAAVDTSGNGSPDHMITLVPVSQQYADGVTCAHGHAKSFWTYAGQLYALAETTGSPDALGYYLALGCDPWGLTESDFKIVWDVSSVSMDPKMKRWSPMVLEDE